MPRIRYKPSRPGPYSGPTGLWLPGEEKDVADALAAHLIGPLGEWFELADPPAPVAPKEMESARTKPASGRKKG